MARKVKLCKIYEAIDNKFIEQFGFRVKETKFLKIVEYLHVPKDSSSLAVTRILFGVAMLFDIPDERGGATMVRRWGGQTCHFPLIPFIRAVPMPYMALVYAALWFGALGITLGYKYQVCSVTFTACYWYLFLIEKSFWNNHSYLFGLIAFLLSFTEANCYWSVDIYLDPSKKSETVPYWNYFILKYQFFILYFMAGLKKGTAEWLTGYSVLGLSEHWVFDPFKIFLTVPQIDYFIVHWFIFAFDLTVAVWMMWAKTRNVAMLFCALFHLMNSRLFRIGMFPWVCLATMPLFYPFDWPKAVISYIKEKYANIKYRFFVYLCHQKYCEYPAIEDANDANIVRDEKGYNQAEQETTDDCDKELKYPSKSNCFKDFEANVILQTESKPVEESEVAKNESSKFADSKTINSKQIITTYMILVYVVIQLFLPYSHFITKGYNNWTNGLYGYSWDMMVHSWDTQSVVIKVVDNESKQEYFIDPTVYTLSDRWTKHGDMVYQYARCLKDILLQERQKHDNPGISANLSIYVDVWCSMNGRFSQRLFDSKVDLLNASWSPFKDVPYLMTLLDEAIHWRSTLEQIAEDVHSWGNDTNVVFLADFPGYEQEKYIAPELVDATITLLEGAIVYETEATPLRPGFSYLLRKGKQKPVDSGVFHKILVTGEKPAYYMYMFINSSEVNTDSDYKIEPKLPIFNELYTRFKGMYVFASIVISSLYRMLFGCHSC